MSAVGPITRIIDNGAFYKRQIWYRSRPVNHMVPLPYDMDTYRPIHTDPGENPDHWKSWSIHPLRDDLVNLAVAKARDRLNDAMGASAGLGVNLVEWKQSLGMIAKRGLQLVEFTRALRKGNFRAAYEAIRDRVPSASPPKGLRRGKPLASNYLEYHFGWSPLVADIYDACDVLQSPLRSMRVRGSATVRDRTKSTYSSPPFLSSETERFWMTRCRLGADISVSNPNLRLASQLGLVNPASLVWEVVPFSFVIDWFLPVGDFLSQWTDFIGLDVQNPYTTLSGSCSQSYRSINTWPGNPYNRLVAKERFVVQRTLGIQSYKLRPGRVTGLSASRGLTAIALLIQQLRGR